MCVLAVREKIIRPTGLIKEIEFCLHDDIPCEQSLPVPYTCKCYAYETCVGISKTRHIRM